MRGQSGSLKESSLPSLHFFFSLWFFFSLFCFVFFYLKRRRYQEEAFEIERQKWDSKMKRQSRSLKESSLPSLHFFFLYGFFSFFVSFSFFMLEKKKMLGESV
jgi:hypothetical protein